MIFEDAVKHTLTPSDICTHTQPSKSKHASLFIINAYSIDQYICSVMEGWQLNGQSKKTESRSETEGVPGEYKKDKAVMGSSSKLMWSIEITYQLDLTDPIPVARNGDQGCS